MSTQVDRMFRAFADETRLRILHLLTRGELCVCDIMKAMNAPQSKISRHLAYLRKASLTQDRKEGLWRYYSLSKPNSAFQRRLIQCIRQCFEEVEVLKRDAAKLKKMSKRRCC